MNFAYIIIRRMYLGVKILIFILLLGTISLYAQQDATNVRVNAHVFKKIQKDENNKINKIPLPGEPVLYGFFADKNTAENVCTYMQNNNGFVPEQYKDQTGTSYADGSFETPAFINGYIFVLTWDYEGKSIFKVENGKTNYDVNLEVQRIDELIVIKTDTIKRPWENGTLPPGRKNGTDPFPINIYRTSDYMRNSTRLIIQTYAVDCLTEDTVDLCNPIVLENDEYHSLQDKRKNYQYMQRDSLHKGYRSDYHLEQGKELDFHTVIYFTRPKGMEKRHFKGPYKVFLEDYHHVIDSFGWNGTCLDRDSWKFLDYGDVYGRIKLTPEEFYEEAKIQINNVTKTLGLTYVRGKDVLVDNEENDSIKRELLQILRAYNVLKPKIIGFSSPEGGYAGNEDLAKRRGRQAANFLRINCEIEPRVATWEEVAKELDKMNQPEDAAFIRQAISESKEKDPLYDNTINGKLKNRDLNRYNEIIEPALERLRKMEFSFGYIDKRPMTAREVVKHYYNNKKYYLSGDSICTYSNGDFYHLYENIRDEAELDTVTMIAYKKLRTFDNFHTQKFAPYVINRMALLKLKQGQPDSTILEPLLNLENRRIGYPYSPSIIAQYTIKMNRKEVIQNQALTMFLLDKIDGADKLLTWLKASLDERSDSSVLKFISYVDLINFEGAPMNPAEKQRYEVARKTIEASAVNKAILYSELPEWKKTKEAREKWIDLLDDNDPKKWYLKGLVWAWKDVKHAYELNRDRIKLYANIPFQKLSQVHLDSLKRNDIAAYYAYQNRLKEYEDGKALDKEDEDVKIDGIPYYLAYFQHCFDIDKSTNQTFKRYYFNEGLVSDDLRKKFPYKRENIRAYRKLFRMLKRYDDGVRTELMKKGV